MSKLYPLLMAPLFDRRPWGRLDLSPIYGQAFSEKIGESWLTGDNCKVQNGPLAGKLLAEVAGQFRRELVGESAPNEDRFPLLAKFLFPQEKLSVQVHPDDDDARAIGQPWGKTECWYVAHAEPGAEIGLGLKPGVTRAQFEKSVHENRAEELLNWVKVFPEDMIYVAGGTVHTLGPGSIIVETQQQSDTTFRLYDYGRPRELHLEHGMRVIKETASSGKVKPQPSSKLDQNGNCLKPLVFCPYFVVEKFDLHSEQRVAAADARSSAQILVATDGAATLNARGCEPVTFGKGDAVIVPACISEFTIQPRQRTKFLRSYVPGTQVRQPDIVLN